MTRWQYLVLERAGWDTALDRTLTYHGADGWELVTMLPLDASNLNACVVRLIFKRPAREHEKETNKRPAQTRLPDGTVAEREWSPRERYMLFGDGFRAGASMRAFDPKKSGLGAYDRGYAEGQRARGDALTDYAKEIGYEPTILRQAPVDPLHPNGRCTCSGEGTCPWCRKYNDDEPPSTPKEEGS